MTMMAMQPKPDALARGIYLFREMARIRAFERGASLALQRGEIYGSLHPSIGQEAVAVGLCSNLRRTDLITSTHRGHGHVLAKGASTGKMMAELFGRKSGTCGGKGGSMHVADLESGVLGANGIVAGSLTIAVGAAQGIQLRKMDSVVVCFFGDGATNRGPFLEALNWAQLYRLPVIFVCEDNKFAAYTHGASTIAGAGPAARADAIGLKTIQLDGGDILEIDAEVQKCVSDCRSGNGPWFIHIRTYRLEGHTLGDEGQYRSAEEVARHWARDPISTLHTTLCSLGVEPSKLKQIETEIEAEIVDAVEFARTAPWPVPSDAFLDVQDLGAPVWPG